METNADGGEEKRSPDPRRILYVLSVGFACFYGASLSLVGLQTSIAVKHSIGSTSILVGYVASIVSSLLFAPFLLRRYGPKTTLLIGEIIWPLFTLANFYPEWITMIPGAIFFGLAQPMALASSGVIAASVARMQHADDAKATHENQNNIGIFLVFVCVGQIFSNGLTGVILKGLEFMPDENHTFELSFSVPNVTEEHLLQCGSYDCPADYAYSEVVTHKHSKLIPNRSSVYVILSVYLVIHAISVLIHYIGLPTECAGAAKIDASKPLLAKQKSTYISDLLSTFRCLKRHLSSLQGFLILPVTFYYGLFESFIWSELNRAYVSCTIGVQMLGFTTALLDVVSLLTSLAVSKSSGRFGIISIATASFVTELANYCFLFFWIPTPQTLFLPFLLAISFGVSHGLRRNVTYLISSTIFADVNTAFSLQMTAESLGIALGYGWSTPLCVTVKLIIMLAMLCISTLSWAAAIYRFRTYTLNNERLISD